MAKQITFSDLYRDMLANFTESDSLSLAMGFPSANYLNTLEDELKISVAKSTEDPDIDKRAQVYQKLIYDLNPTTLIDIYAIGYLMGLWEYKNTSLHSSGQKEDLMKAAAISLRALLKVETDIEEIRNLSIEFTELVEDSI